MKRFAWALGSAGALLGTFAISILLEPKPRSSDAPALAMLGAALLAIYLAAALATQVRWWHWWIPAAWLGLDVAALFLAYKDTFIDELIELGPLDLAGQIGMHLLVAPFEVFLGFAVGFVEPGAWVVILTCLAVALLAAELLRRRLWPSAQAAEVRNESKG